MSREARRLRLSTRGWRLLASATSVLTVLSLAGPGGGLEASQVRPLNLEEMTQRAATIVSGRCVAVSTHFDPGVRSEVTVATFAVSRSLKGPEQGTLAVRMPVSADIGSGVGGLPGFRRGDEVILFLYGESSLGLRAPVGLGQGSFRVVKDKRGRAVALNDLANRHLLRGLTPSARERVAARFDLGRPTESTTPTDLLGMVEAILEKDNQPTDPARQP